MKKRSLLFIFLVFILFSCSNNEEWTTYGGSNQRTGYANTTGPKKMTSIKWKFNALEHNQYRLEEGSIAQKMVLSTPILCNGLVLFESDDGYFYAVDFETGEKKWEFKTNSLYIDSKSSAVANEDFVFFTTVDGFAYTLNINNGEKLWSYRSDMLNGNVSSPIIEDSLVLFKLGTYQYAFNIYTGEKIWKSSVSHLVYSKSIASYDGMVFYSPDIKDYFYCYDINNGRENWRFKIDGEVISTPAITNGVVFFKGSKILNAIDAYTGQELWSYRVGGVGFNKPTVNDFIVYISALNYIYAIDARIGQEQWKLKIGEALINSDIVVADDLLYITTEDRLIAFNKNTGQRVWDFKTEKLISSSPIVANGVVIFSCCDGFVYALE